MGGKTLHGMYHGWAESKSGRYDQIIPMIREGRAEAQYKSTKYGWISTGFENYIKRSPGFTIPGKIPGLRLWKEVPETIMHITTAFKILSEKEYMDWHNQVTGLLYRNICTEHKLETYRSKSNHISRWWRMTELRSSGTFRFKQTELAVKCWKQKEKGTQESGEITKPPVVVRVPFIGELGAVTPHTGEVAPTDTWRNIWHFQSWKGTW